jgi:hypothetical protein
MKRFKGVMLGMLLAFSLTLSLTLSLGSATAWAQDAPPQAPQAPVPQSENKPSPALQADAPPPPPDGQSPSTDPNAPDPPNRVARLQYMSGSVSIQPQGTGDWAAGVINRPLTSSDNVWTDKDSRAELNVGSGLIRMSSESSLTLTSVSDNTTQLELHQGTLSLRVHNLAPGETYEIDTPNTAFTVQTAGEYRVDVDSNGNTSEVTVRRGEGQASNNGSSVAINAGQQAHFGDGDSGEVAQAAAPDSFDSWCNSRDQRGENSVSARYVSPDMIGSQDLDEYGTWHDTPEYGEVWTPSGVPGDWAPYHYGNWAWVAPWGWTWVDDEPWGFAPFHYGRWVYGGGNWGWAPGPYWGRPFYAPALVGWFGGPGWGGGFGFGFGGGIGWCPLGWGEPFFPWYHAGFGYFNHVNIYNTRFANFNRFGAGFGRPGFGAGFHYANLNAPGGRFAVSQRVFANSQSVRNAGVRMSANDFSRASLGARVPVNPTRASRLGATAGRATAVPPTRAFSRATISRASAMNGARTASRGTQSAGSFARPSGGAVARPNTGAMGGQSASSRFVPRPPTSMRSSGGGMEQSRSSLSQSQQMRSAPSASDRGYANRGYANGGYAAQGSARGGSNYVPRPSGAVRSSGPIGSSGYASNGYRGNYSSPSRSYNSGSSYRSYPGPSYRSYSASPSSRSYSAPSSSRGYSARSYSAPSSRGSSGGYSGGHSYGGGGGHSSGGGGGHSSGGGGGHGGRR